jgi:5-methylcytosine-specific restriction enzyme subunit McrC
VRVPIRNIFYLLTYAWDVLESDDISEVGVAEGSALEDLLASVLANRTERLLRRGLEQNYRERREDSGSIRGRVDFQEMAKRVLQRKGLAHIVCDELSPDTAPNRILKATIGTMLHFKSLEDVNRDKLALLYRGLREVSDTRISETSFCRVRLHRNNQEYRVLMSLCEIVQRYALPEQHGRGFQFVEFTEDQMGKLFQVFLTRFYQKRQNTYRVDSRRLDWCISQKPEVESFWLPQLQTDIVLSNSDKQLVIEAKFYREPFDLRFGKATVRSAHINQLFAYMQNIAANDRRGRPVDGILLYAAVSGPFQQDWQILGHNMRVAGVDLSDENWREIETRLLSTIHLN